MPRELPFLLVHTELIAILLGSGERCGWAVQAARRDQAEPPSTRSLTFPFTQKYPPTHRAPKPITKRTSRGR